MPLHNRRILQVTVDLDADTADLTVSDGNGQDTNVTLRDFVTAAGKAIATIRKGTRMIARSACGRNDPDDAERLSMERLERVAIQQEKDASEERLLVTTRPGRE